MECVKKLDEDVLSALRKVDWPDVTAKVLLLARREMFKKGIIWFYWKGPEDYVNEAITLFLDGRRVWKPSQVSFLWFLHGTIKSVISHDAAKASKEIKVSVPFDSNTQDALHIRLNPEEKIASKELLDQLNQVLNNDVDIKIVKLIISYGEVTPREMADSLGVPVADIYNAKKRLQRALLSLKYHLMKDESDLVEGI